MAMQDAEGVAGTHRLRGPRLSAGSQHRSQVPMQAEGVAAGHADGCAQLWRSPRSADWLLEQHSINPCHAGNGGRAGWLLGGNPLQPEMPARKHPDTRGQEPEGDGRALGSYRHPFDHVGACC
uniref:Uncharacterized protein n=1 Tax=uncultured marine virus TaxID=186617 RepID=A0A0F7L2P3_9VIRU|nr:hypothetical protein [uncultured marine virus]